MGSKTTYNVRWSKQVARQLDLVPAYIRDKFLGWAFVVERVGLPEARKMSGYHDEPLKGPRRGERSIRLNRAYRAIYIERADGTVRIVEVTEVSRHEY